MEDLLQLVCVGGLALVVVALLGHGIWVAFAGLLRLASGRQRPEVRSAPPIPDDDLPAFRRQVARLREAGLVEAALADDLLAKALAAAATAAPFATPPVAELAEGSADAALPPHRQLERLLAGFPRLAESARQRVLRIYDTLGDDALATLAPGRQFDLSRLLAHAGRADDALRGYRALVARYADHAGCVPTALEAARLSLRHGKSGAARFFLDALRHKGLTPTQQDESVRLEAELAALLGIAPATASAVMPLAGGATPPVAPPGGLRPRLAGESPPEGLRPRLAEAVAAAGSVGALAAAARAAAEVEQPSIIPPSRGATIPPPLPPPPPRPRRSFAELLAGFLEEKNIRWGELIGGLLIVASSVALVVSLWDQLAQQPTLQFLVFVGGTSAVYGAGLYTHHRWRLPSTSRGLLMVATLLAPLNFLAMAGTWRQLDVAALVFGGLATAAFALLAGLAGRILMPPARWSFAVGTVGVAATLPVLPHLARMPLTADLALPLAAALPIALYCGALASLLYRLRTAPLDAPLATRLLCTTGAASFALVVALGLLVAPEGHVWRELGVISPLAALAAAMLTAVGLAIVRDGEPSAALGPARTAATAVALGGALFVLAAVPLAWPDPVRLLVSGLVVCAALAGLALRYRMPALHLPAAVALTTAYLVGFHLLWGNLTPGEPLALRWPAAGPLAQSGTALVALFAALAAVAELLARRGLAAHGRIVIVAAAGVAALSLAAVTLGGRGSAAEALRAAAVYGVYGAGCLAVNFRWRQRALSYAGLALLLAATAWTLWWSDGLSATPRWSSVLAAELATMAAAAALLRKRAVPSAAAEVAHPPDMTALVVAFREPLANTAVAAAPIAIVLAFVGQGLDTHWPTATAALLAVGALCLAWNHRQAAWTWCGSALALFALLHVFAWPVTRGGATVENPWTTALLAHATLAGAANLALAWLKRRRAAPGEAAAADESAQPSAQCSALPPPPRGRDLDSVVLAPLGASGVATSLAAVPLMLTVDRHATAPAPFSAWSLDLLWLAGVWLAVAVANGWRSLFGGGQAALAGAVVCAVAARQTGAWHLPNKLSIEAAALGLLALGWTAVRIALRKSAPAARLLGGELPGVDRWVAYATVLLFAAAAYLGAWPGIANELTARRPGMPLGTAAMVDPFVAAWGWTALAVLTIGLVASLWDRWRIGEALSAVLVLGAAPLVAAEHFQSALAGATALRWGAALALFAGGAAMWLREPLGRTLSAIHCRLRLGPWASPLSQGLLLALAAAPLFLLTAATARLALAGIETSGPARGVFASVDLTFSLLFPLVVAAAALVGFAVREASPGYAFAAGWVANAALVLGTALWMPRLGVAEAVHLAQLATLGAAVWAMLWIALRRNVLTWRERGERPTAPPLLRLQVAAAVAGCTWTLLPGTAAVALVPLFGRTGEGAAAAGAALGWLAGGATLAALFAHAAHRRRPVHPNWMGLAGMAAIAMLACTVAGLYGHWWAYRSLLLGWPMYAFCVVLATWWVAVQRTPPEADGPPAGLVRSAALWVRLAGLSGVWLAIQVVLRYSVAGGPRDDLAWAAAAIALASLAGAAMAVWRRAEGWAFASGLGANLAASLLVWRLHADAPLELWWAALVQANAVACAGVALLWLAARRRLLAERQLGLSAGPLLTTQIVLALGSAAALPAIGLALLALDPPLAFGVHRQVVAQLGHAASWLGLAMSAAAATWFFRQAAPRRWLHGVAVLLGGACVLAACRAAESADAPWLAYRTLVFAPLAAALALAALGRFGAMLLRAVAKLGATGLDDAAGGEDDTRRAAAGWSTLPIVAAATLAVRGVAADPTQHEWSAVAVLIAAVEAGLVALLLGGASRVYLSGALAHVAGTLLWYGDRRPISFVEDAADLLRINVLCAGASGLAWLLLDWRGASTPSTSARSASFGVALIQGRRPGSSPSPGRSPGEPPESSYVVGPKGQRFADVERREWLALRAARTFFCGPFPQGFALGWENVRPVGAKTENSATPKSASEGNPLSIPRWRFGLVSPGESSHYPAVALVCGVGLLTALAALGIIVDLTTNTALTAATPLAWAGCGLLAALAAIRCWRQRDTAAVAGAYAIAVLAVALVLDRYAGAPALLALWTSGLLSIFVPATSAIAAYVLSAPRWLCRAAAREARQELLPTHGHWFLTAQSVLGLLAIILGAWVSLDVVHHPRLLPRLVGCLAAPASFAGVLLLLTRTRGGWRAAFQEAPLLLPPLAAAELLWTLVPPVPADRWLHPAVALAGAATAMLAWTAWRLYPRLAWSEAWTATVRRALPILAAVLAVSLGYALWHEALLFPDDRATGKLRGAPVYRPLMVATALALAWLTATALRLAVNPARDPYRLSERGRQAYVYAAELLAAVCWLHAYLCVPKLLPIAVMDRWWTIIVMLLAFGGAAVAEWFQRRGMPTLSQPLARTAAALPCIPLVLSLDVVPVGDFLERYRDHLRMPYWTLLFLVGGFYAWVAYTRRSLLATVLAVVATNAGLWWLLEERGLAFLEYPHYWLIPPALLALVSEYFNRQRLSPAASGGIRYLALSVIYLSTTVDMFRDGLERSMPWGPILLTLLSVAGILGGMLLRVRSFLLLGTAFLLLTLATMVYYASFDRGNWWVLYASGIGLGAAILALFGLFEKRRHEMLEAVGKLKQWER